MDKEGENNSVKNLVDELTSLFRAEGNRPMKIKELAKRLGVPSDTYRNFRDEVRALYRNGFLVRVRKGRYALGEMSNLVEGRIRVRRDGSARLAASGEPESSVYISRFNRLGAIDGDRVRVMVTGETGRESPRGKVVEVLERAHPRVAGYLSVGARGRGLVQPGNPRIDREIIVSGDMVNAREGDLVVVDVVDWGRGSRYAHGIISEVYDDSTEMECDILTIILEHGLPLAFPPEVLEEAGEISSTISGEEIRRRNDCRMLRTFTIDPGSAHDFDDALSVERIDGDRWRVGIHIADVSHYVRPDSAIDREAMSRGNSVYLVDRAIPMLPERLSGGICSLKPGEDRLAVSLFAIVDRGGRIGGIEFGETVIRSRSRLTYEDAQEIIEMDSSGDGDPLTRDILDLFHLSRTLREKRMERGSLDFDRPESFVVLNEDGLPVDIRKVEQLDSHRLIEEFMVMANEIVANHLAEEEIPFIVRVHESPSPEDLEVLTEYLNRFGYAPLWKKEGIRPETFQRILHMVRGNREEMIIVNLVLRSMKRALYAVKNIGHFGLASPLYTHFTSPIRRFVDLTVHRRLKQALGSGGETEGEDVEDRLGEIANHASERERTADLAEWDSVDLKKVQFMEAHLGDIFPGTISGLNPAGFFVQLDPFFVEGMVPFRDLGDDYYDFIEEQYVIRGRRRGRTFSLGDRVTVQVARTNRRRREIDFFLIDHSP